MVYTHFGCSFDVMRNVFHCSTFERLVSYRTSNYMKQNGTSHEQSTRLVACAS
jgi:hypothetical protein